MKIENFHVEDIVYLVSDGARYDLHNDFLFSALTFNAENFSVVLGWNSAEISLRVRFQGVFLLKVKEANSPCDRVDAAITSFVGFLLSGDVAVMDGFLPRPNISDAHFIVGFEDGAAIKVGCTSAILETEARF